MSVPVLTAAALPHHAAGLLERVRSRGPRVHARVGGLAAEDVKGEDGLR